MASLEILPPKILTSDPGSYAQKTIRVRKPWIIDRVISKNGYPSGTVEKLGNLKSEIATGVLGRVKRPVSSDRHWQTALELNDGRTWHDVPWLFAEAYFYRRLLDCTDYFRQGPLYLTDPFGVEKSESLEGPAGAIAQLKRTVPMLPSLGSPDNTLRTLLLLSLWGNISDTSNMELTQAGKTQSTIETKEDMLVVNDLNRVMSLLSGRRLHRIDWVTDNMGTELAFDLLCIDHLLNNGYAVEVAMHLKNMPYFVSDAMIKDSLNLLARMGEEIELKDLQGRLTANMAHGRLSLRTQDFWASPLNFHECRSFFPECFDGTDLVVFKGDVNYRRLLDDRKWPYTTDMATVTNYFEYPFMALRTLKADLMIDLKPGQAEQLTQQETDLGNPPNNWLTGGKYGVVRLVM